ncbi:MAG: Hsp20/alpha crystallin family protein [Candidatus Aenigmarchaeota archaeon]|nr:Hsp20/alpha crystallin family protein [Candidatus Aenigmarchaeota archaeon]
MNRKKKDFIFYWEKPDKSADRGRPFAFQAALPEVRAARNVPVNISDKVAEIVISVEMPGFKRSEISLNVTENAVEIVASKKEEKIDKGKTFYHEERASGAIRRVFTLPAKVDPDKAQAKIENAVLVITLPKKETKDKKKKRLEIL